MSPPLHSPKVNKIWGKLINYCAHSHSDLTGESVHIVFMLVYQLIMKNNTFVIMAILPVIYGESVLQKMLFAKVPAFVLSAAHPLF